MRRQMSHTPSASRHLHVQHRSVSLVPLIGGLLVTTDDAAGHSSDGLGVCVVDKTHIHRPNNGIDLWIRWKR